MRPYLLGTTSDKGKSKDSEKDFLVNSDLIVKCTEARKHARERNFMDAYKIMDQLNMQVRGRHFTDNDRGYVKKVLKHILKLQYYKVVTDRYKTLIDQYRNQNDSGIALSMIVDGHPKQRWQTDTGHWEFYIKQKAIEQISEDTKNDRYGGYMHTVIGEIIREFEAQENEQNKSTSVIVKRTIPRIDNDHDDR